MTRDDILTEVYNSQILNKMANKYASRIKDGNSDDYIGYCLQVVCEIDEDKLIKLYEDGELYFYVVSIAKNQLFNVRSKFNQLMENNIEKVDIEYAKDSEEEF